MITVEEQSPGQYLVTVAEGSSTSRHTVSVSDEYHARVTNGSISKEELVRKSFVFLLKREPKESILSRFDLPVISRYFPEYEREIGS